MGTWTYRRGRRASRPGPLAVSQLSAGILADAATFEATLNTEMEAMGLQLTFAVHDILATPAVVVDSSDGMGIGVIIVIAAGACAALLLGIYLMKKQRGRAKLPAGIAAVTSTVDAPISIYDVSAVPMDMRPNDAALAAAAAEKGIATSVAA